jgi:hypothetical protein
MSPSDAASDPPTRNHRVRDLLIEIGVVVVLGVHLVAFAAIRNDQQRYADEARDIADWALAHDVARIAWPADLRAAVPALLDAGVTPVLVEPSEVNAQQLVLNDTPVLVGRDLPADLDEVTADRHEAGALDAALVDLDAAAPQPLDDGEAVEIEYSRPYIYAPIRDSQPLVVGEQLEFPLTLAPGSYVLRTEAYDPETSLDMILSAIRGDGTPMFVAHELKERVFEPQELRFDVPGTEPQEVELRIEVWPRADAEPGDEETAGAILHGWTMERVD